MFQSMTSCTDWSAVVCSRRNFSFSHKKKLTSETFTWWKQETNICIWKLFSQMSESFTACRRSTSSCWTSSVSRNVQKTIRHEYFIQIPTNKSKLKTQMNLSQRPSSSCRADYSFSLHKVPNISAPASDWTVCKSHSTPNLLRKRKRTCVC